MANGNSMPRPELSKRELEVLHLLCNEKSNKEIADLLCIDLRTVESHRKNIMIKIGAKNLAGLVSYQNQLHLQNVQNRLLEMQSLIQKALIEAKGNKE